MAFVLADRVKQTSTTTGVGDIFLTGAHPVGYQNFIGSGALASGDSTYYVIEDGTNWETGIGTVTDEATDRLTRDTIFASSNGGAAVNWGSGTRNVFIGLPGGSVSGLLDTGSNGILVQTSARAYSRRTITVTGPAISIINGNGVSGNPAITMAVIIPTASATMLFRENSAPTGWTQDTSIQSGSVLRIINTTAGGNGGSIDVAGGTLTAATAGAHSHTVDNHTHSLNGVGDLGGASAQWRITSLTTGATSPGTDSQGNHSHNVTSSLFYQNSILCNKDA